MACSTGSLSLASSSVTASAWKRSCDMRDSPNGSPALTYFFEIRVRLLWGCVGKPEIITKEKVAEELKGQLGLSATL